MNRKTFITLMVLLGLGAPTAWAQSGRGGNANRVQTREEIRAHHQQQKRENKAFRNTLKDLSPQEKAQAISQHRNEQYQENTELWQKKHQERMTRFTDKLNNNPNLTDEQKQDLLNHWENQYQQNVAFRDQQHQENMNLLEQLANDPNLTDEQIRSQLKAQGQTQRQENKQHRQEQKQENQAKRQEIRSEVPASKEAVSDQSGE